MTLPSLPSWSSTASDTTVGRPEHVDPGLAVRLDAPRPSRAGRRPWSPTAPGCPTWPPRPPPASRTRASPTTPPPRRRPGEPAAEERSRSTAAASAAGEAARDVRRLVALDRGGRAHADDLRARGLLGAGGLQRVECGRRGVRQLVALGEEDRRADRPADEHRRRRARSASRRRRPGSPPAGATRACARGRRPAPRPRRRRSRPRRRPASCSWWPPRGSRAAVRRAARRPSARSPAPAAWACPGRRPRRTRRARARDPPRTLSAARTPRLAVRHRPRRTRPAPLGVSVYAPRLRVGANMPRRPGRINGT